MFAALLSFGNSFAQTDEEIFIEAGVLCVSTLGMAAIMTEDELPKMVFTQDAKWWRSILINVINSSEADRRVEERMMNIKNKWNDEEITWKQLLDIGQQCSELKLQLQSAAN